MRQASPGITGQRAPDREVDRWFGLPDGQTRSRPSDITAPVVYLSCSQSCCPGCHGHGFPTMAAVRARAPEDGEALAATSGPLVGLIDDPKRLIAIAADRHPITTGTAETGPAETRIDELVDRRT